MQAPLWLLKSMTSSFCKVTAQQKRPLYTQNRQQDFIKAPVDVIDFMDSKIRHLKDDVLLVFKGHRVHIPA